MVRYRMLLLFAGLTLCAVAQAATPDPRARNMAASCSACHGTDGYSEGGMPVIAGMDRALFIASMTDFKSGARPATVMHQHAKGYSDEQIGLLADYFSAQKRK